jgi:uncharacterized protein (TIGR03086 family)
MTLPDLYTRAVNTFATLVARVEDGQWQRPTPCTDWNVRQLVNHLVYEELWSAPLFDGATIAEVGDRFEGDLLGDDPQTTVATAAATATGAVLTPGAMDRIVHLSFGDTPAEEYVSQLLADHVVHGWDLAVAIGADRTIDPDALAYLAPWFAQREELYRGGGAIGPRVDVSPDASEQDRFIAAFGRDPAQ